MREVLYSNNIPHLQRVPNLDGTLDIGKNNEMPIHVLSTERLHVVWIALGKIPFALTDPKHQDYTCHVSSFCNPDCIRCSILLTRGKTAVHGIHDSNADTVWDFFVVTSHSLLQSLHSLVKLETLEINLKYSKTI